MKTMYRPTVMGLAFYNMAQQIVNHNRVSAQVRNNVKIREREFMVREPEWNAHLSFKTAKELKEQGII